jgi:thiamine-phosphate pyrophosphorylase
MKGLHLVTDRGLCAGRPLEEVVMQAVQGGVTCVQLREKDLSTRAFVEEAARIKALLSPVNVPLIINDRVDVALAVGAKGVHVGQNDMPCALVRRLMGPAAIIGLSVETWEDVVRAQDQPVDYLGVSPVFETPTKTDTRSAWGLEGLARIKAYSRHPLVAIGGLNASNIAKVVQAGAEGIAIVSAICGAPDPNQAARDLIQLFLAAQPVAGFPQRATVPIHFKARGNSRDGHPSDSWRLMR